jgi:hypothetical protein
VDVAKKTKTRTVKLAKAPNTKGTKSVSPIPSVTTVTLQGLTMTLFGVTTFPETAQILWEELTESFIKSSIEASGSVSNFDTTIQVTNVSFTSKLMQGQRQLQDGSVVVEYTQIMGYASTDTNITPEYLAEAPFQADKDRQAFIATVSASDDPTLQNVNAVSEVTVPTTPGPTSSPSWSAPVSLTPTAYPTYAPTTTPTDNPSVTQTSTPTTFPTSTPTATAPTAPATTPTTTPTTAQTATPTATPTTAPTTAPTTTPTTTPTTAQAATPTATPTTAPTTAPTTTPTATPTTALSTTSIDSPTVAPNEAI